MKDEEAFTFNDVRHDQMINEIPRYSI